MMGSAVKGRRPKRVNDVDEERSQDRRHKGGFLYASLPTLPGQSENCGPPSEVEGGIFGSSSTNVFLRILDDKAAKGDPASGSESSSPQQVLVNESWPTGGVFLPEDCGRQTYV